jgi:endonuclease YncB( thermonuclease family)
LPREKDGRPYKPESFHGLARGPDRTPTRVADDVCRAVITVRKSCVNSSTTDKAMKRTPFALVALAAVLTVSNVRAQELQPGYDPSGALPTVSLPQRSSYQPAATPAKPAQEASTSILRSGGAQTSTDMLKAPEGALKAASASSPKPTVSRTAQTPASTEASKYVAGMTIYGKAKAYDGHSLLVDGNPVRLNGIEAPGAAQLCTTAQGVSWRCGRKASEKLAALVDGRNVRCVVTSPAGHGAAAICSASQAKDIGAIMVSEGLAVPNRHSAGVYAREMLSASGAKRGMWMGGFTDPAKWRLQNR